MISIGEDVKKLKPLHTFIGMENKCSHNEKQHGVSSKLKKIKKIEPYDPAILFLGIYPKKLK